MGLETEFGGFERVFLRHGLLGPVETIQDELAEERVADFSSARDMMLACAIDEIELVAFRICGGWLDVFAELNGAFGAEDKRPAVAPTAKPVRSKPIDTVVARCTVVSRK